MSLGNYSVNRTADVQPIDMDIFVVYQASRDANADIRLFKMNTQDVIKPIFHNNETGGNQTVEVLGGLYSLRLPFSAFNTKGIYNIMIRPSEIRTRISDCGLLSALPNVKGIVIDSNNVDSKFQPKIC